MGPARKKSASTSRSFLDQDKYTAELSSGQLVIGITILLVFGLACFLLGVLVGKFEPVERTTFALETPEDSPASGKTPIVRDAAPGKKDTSKTGLLPAPTPPAKAGSGSSRERRPEIAKAKPSQEGKQVTPRDVNELSKPSSAAASGIPTIKPKIPKPVRFPETPPAARVSTGGPTVDSPDTSPKPTTPKAEQKSPSPSPTKPIVEAKAKRPDPPKKIDPPNDIQVAATPKTETQEDYWTVQLVSLSKKENGPKELLRAQSKSPYKVTLVDEGKRVTILAGRFDTRQEAEKARQDIRKKFPEFADCFLKQVQ